MRTQELHWKRSIGKDGHIGPSLGLGSTERRGKVVPTEMSRTTPPFHGGFGSSQVWPAVGHSNDLAWIGARSAFAYAGQRIVNLAFERIFILTSMARQVYGFINH